VALDRQSIEKKDFPVGRRGYDPDAVDAHLVTLADEIAELRQSSRRRSDTLASSASEQVRAIVEAAETSAADIQREAESDAHDILQEATAEAQTTRELATDEAREFVGRVSHSTDSMVDRLSSMQTELDTLMDTLRGGAGRLSEDLSTVQSDMLEVRGIIVPRPPFEPEATDAPEPEVFYETEPAVTYESEAEVAPIAERDVVVAVEPGSADPDGDAEGARLIALNMALNGTSRGDTARYLDENFAIADSGGLLDEVYANVEG
jgi:DivIVA domain-containing protein